MGSPLERRRSILRILRERRSIRKFIRSRMPEEVARLIVEAAVRAPTYSYLQAYTIIWVRSEELRERLAELCEGQDELVRSSAAIFLICADLNRTRRMLDLLGHRHVLESAKHPVESIFAVLDSGLLAAFMIIAAEALGYGSTILDYPLVYPREFARLFELPRGVTPLILLCVGERGEAPPLRPRLPLPLVFHEDGYREASDEELSEYLARLEEALERENYVRKYIGLDMRYLEYLRLKTGLDDSLKKAYDAVEKYLKENLMRF